MKVVFCNVDTQKDFMNSYGNLYIKDAEIIKLYLRNLTSLARELGITVVNTADYHSPNSKEISSTPNFKTTFPPHCIAGTPGSDFIRETSPNNRRGDNYYICGWDNDSLDLEKLKRCRNIVIQKDEFDVFKGNKHTANIFKFLNPKIVVVYGVAANICVNYAVLGLRKRGYGVIVVHDAIKGLPGKSLTPLFESWRKLGVKLENTSFIVNEFLI